MKQEFYTADYYLGGHLGHEPYAWDNKIWRQFFSHVASKIVEVFNPVTVLDAGCAIGFLVDELRKRHVHAVGFDFSEYAISVAQAHGLKDFVFQEDLISVAHNKIYDLVTCIEIVEHIPEDYAHNAIESLCGLSNHRILFSSTPDDFEESTHFNVRSEDYWLGLFKEFGFYKVGEAPWLCKHALILEKA